MNIQELLCVDAREESSLLEETYNGTCRPHMNRFILAKKILRAKEYLSQLVLTTPPNFSSDLMKAMCETFKIKNQNSTAYMLQMNGAAEATNKNIKKILRKMVDNYKQWNEKLPFALLGYRTTVPVIPAEIEIPSLEIIQEAELSDVEWIQSWYEQLVLIDGKRMKVVCHSHIYQNIMARASNKKVRSRQFTPGQLVLKRIFPYQDKAKVKFSSNWKGPYMVHLVLTGGVLILADMGGEIWLKPINLDAVNRYYV
uniref:Uncharacterized protein LOC104246902 n=1 Tax=Nicotiana sylvestris TaxID=4096 RepID=A0A1U7YDA6_NICSY|nr:PREDICTED: uncharacterized protein LOC104246902 [Nicotiana sylvestris]